VSGALPKRALFERIVALTAALVCLLFAAGLYDVRLGFARAPLPTLPNDAGARDASLSIVAVDEQGKPVAGASARVFVIRGDASYFAGEGTADTNGHASVGELPRGEAWVLVYADKRARASSRLVLDAGPRELRVVLRPAGALDVVVVDENDKPLPGAHVEARASDPLPFVADTDRDGKARVDRLGPPPWRVRVSARGYDDATRTGVAPGAGPLRVRLERLGAIAVRVVDGQGETVPGATVLAAGSGLSPARSTVTDMTGGARIAGLRPGVYDVEARLGDKVSPTEMGIALARGETREVKLVLESGRLVRVTVHDGTGDGAPPIADASVVLAPQGLSSFPLQGKTDKTGLVVLGPIARGSAAVSARASGFVPRTIAIGEDALDADIPLLRGGVVTGDVVDDRGYPVAGATIEIVGSDQDGLPIDESSTLSDFRDEHFAASMAGPAPLIPAGELGVMPGPIPDLPHGDFALAMPAPVGGGDPWVTRGDGTFRAEPVTPGRVQVIVRHPLYVEATSDVVTLAPGGTATVHVVLRRGGMLEGRVIEEDKTPVAGARIELAATTGSFERVVYAADDGTFAFAAVPDEVLVSVARPEDPASVAARLVVAVPDGDRKEIEVVLPKLRGGMALHVTDDRGYAISGVEVHAVSLDAKVPLLRTAFTSDDGDVEIPDAVGLPLRLVLLRPSKAPRVEQLDAAPAKLDLEMKEGVTGRGTVTGRDGRDRLEGADVTAYTASGPRHTRTDAEGAFSLDDLAAGRVRLVATHDGHARAEIVKMVADDPAHGADLGAIDLAEAGEVEGTVVDERDDPVPNARVARDAVPSWLPLGPLPPGIVASDREGRFVLRGLPEGEVALEAFTADRGRGYVDKVRVRAGQTTRDVKIVMPEEGAKPREPRGAGSLAVTLGETDGGKAVVVVAVPPASEAEIAGIEPGDRLVSVNDHAVRSIEDARARLSGPLSEDVVLELARDASAGAPASTWRTRVRRERVRR
jgi:protocatechuate 3,4-dioxygenase beta subunit